MHSGIDVSSYQGFPDMERVAKAGHRFVYIKATEGSTYVDHAYSVRQLRAREAGMHTGFYHFLRPRRDRNGRVEAEHFYKTVKGITKGKGAGARLLRLVVDIEVSTLPDPSTREYARDCLTRLAELCDHLPMIYTFPGFLHYWGDELTQHPLWIANFTTAPHPQMPAGWEHWTIWQHSDSGRVPGIGGPVDLNRCPVLGPVRLDRRCY